jgi:ferrous iron transport protein A
MTLNCLAIGRRARVLEVHCGDCLKTRLADLGVLPGTLITAVNRSPLGDPVAYEVRGSVIAIRREDAESIEVEDAG